MGKDSVFSSKLDTCEINEVNFKFLVLV
jgi:hypothetical protein